MKISVPFYFFLLLSISLRGQNNSMCNFRYNLNKPDSLASLPSILKEISGLTDFDNQTVACVQDEVGIIYFYNLETGLNEHTISFADSGDYEGLTHVNGIFYILNSKGILYEVNTKRSNEKVRIYPLRISTSDNEGLCYDEMKNRLLIAPKSKFAKDPENKNLRIIFSVDLTRKKIKVEPLFYYRIDELVSHSSQFMQGNITNEKFNLKKNKNFRPSSIAVDPKTGDIIVLSAEDFGLAIFNEMGDLKNYCPLSPDLYPKAEGITFLPNGSMIITNEGIQGNATLLLWR